jgi:Phage capsid family
MKLSEKIQAAETELTTIRDQLTEATKSLEAEVTLEFVAQVEELSLQLETKSVALDALKRAEQALAIKAVPVIPGAPAIIQGRSDSKITPFDLVIRSALVAFESGSRHVSPEQVMMERYGDDAATKAVVGQLVTKATQNPAMTNVAGWASQLVRDGWLSFMDILSPASIIPRLGLQSYSFDGFESLTIPMRTGSALTDNNLAASWRKEGDPIRVGSVSLSSKKLTPKSMGVIGTFTKELLARSTPNIEAMIRQWILNDTAITLDSYFVSNMAAVAGLRPAGIANGVVGVPSTGATAANIMEDLKTAFAALASANLGSRPVLICHPNNAFALSMSLTATGTAAFPTAAAGTLFGAQIISSTTVPVDVVLLVDASELAFAGGLQTMEFSDVATIHEEYLPHHNRVSGAIDPAGVLPLVDAAAAPASPVRSLFQTHSAGVKAVYGIDWAITRTGAVQIITGVAW